MGHVVVVGASLAGLRAAEVLRGEGFRGAITMVGDEPHGPYDRPPLSKQVLTGEWPPERTALPAASAATLQVTWERGVAATGLDMGARHVTLDDGRSLDFDGLVVATGARARTLPGSEHLAGAYALRTIATPWPCAWPSTPGSSEWSSSGPGSSVPRRRPRVERAGWRSPWWSP